MDNRQLSYFIAMVEEESISKAAEILHLAQPYLSQQLKLLEDELDVKLVDRTTRRFQVTEAGFMLYYRAKQILDLSEAAVKELKDFNAGLKGTLSIACLTSALETMLADKLFQFHRKYPDIDFEVRQYSSPEILELLKRGIIEIGIIRSPLPSPEIFEAIELPSEPMVAVFGKDTNIKGQGGSISLKELSEMPLLVNRRFERRIGDAFKSQGLEPRFLCRIEDTKPLLLLAEKGMGVAIVARDWTGLIADSNLKIMNISDVSMESRNIVVWLKNHYLTLAARHFLEYF